MPPAGVRSLAEDAGLFFRVDYLPPGVIRIERGHARGSPACARAEIPFVDVAVIVDDEGHDPGVAVFGWIGDEAEAADHVAAYDVINGAARSVRALAGQDLVVIAVIRFPGADAIAPLGCGSDCLTERTVRLAARRRPVQAVLLAGRTDDLLCVNRLAIFVLEFIRVFVLRVPISEHGLQRSELVAADAACENLLPARGGVKAPLTVALYDRNRERPVVLPYHEGRRLSALGDDPMLGVVSGEIFLSDIGILHRIAGRDKFLRPGPQY